MTHTTTAQAEPAPHVQPITTTAEPLETKLDPALSIDPAPHEAALPVHTPKPAGEPLQPPLEPHEAAASADLNQWTPQQIQLLKDTVCRGATDDELRLFLYVCQRRRLDPFTKQIHAIKRRQKVDGRWKEVITHQTSIDGFRLIADRTGQYRGQRPFEWCGKDGRWVDVWLSEEAPKAARATVLRQGWEPVIAVALFDEYVQTVDEYARREDPQRPGEFSEVKTGNEVPNAMWQQRPAGQLAKCAEALAFRMGFPEELSGLYTFDEMGQADNPSKGTQRVETSEASSAGAPIPDCPVCHGAMWDNRERKKGPKGWKSAPDFRCKNKNCPGEIVDASNPTAPAEKSASSSAGSAGPRSDADTTSSSSSAAAGSTPESTTPPKSPDSSPSSGASSPSSSEATKPAIQSTTITRETRIDWATGKFAVVQNQRLKDLRWEQLDYFRRNRPGVLSTEWYLAVLKEIQLREDTGGDERDEDLEDDGGRQNYDPYTGAGG